MNQVETKIVVVGSANVDFIVRSERLPRPGETVSGGELITAGGGKGANQAIGCRRLGATVEFVARVGNDGPGQLALSSFRAEGLNVEHVTVDRGTPTGVALILVDRIGQNMISLAPGANARLTVDDVREAAGAFIGAHVLITQLEVPIETVTYALEFGRSRRITTILNPAPARTLPDEILGLADWLTPNEVEATILTGLEVVDVASALEAGRRLTARGPKHVVITLGSRGAALVAPGLQLAVAPFPVDAIDATAAGDAFTAGLAVSVARGLTPAESVEYASACGALAATRPGAQPSLPGTDDVARLLAAHRRGASGSNG